MTRYLEHIAPDCEVDYTDRDLEGPMPTYCADPNCSPKNECDRCYLVRRRTCECCLERPSVVVDRSGQKYGISAIAMCETCDDECKAECDVEDAKVTP